MRLICVQYTSPRRGPAGYRWLTDGGCGEVLRRFSALLAEVDWSREENRGAGGICILPAWGKGIVFRKIAGLPDSVGRDKITTNAGIFSLDEAAREGLNGIWQLPFLSDPREDDRDETVVFHPSSAPCPPGLEELAELPRSAGEVMVVIGGNGGSLRHIPLAGVPAGKNAETPPPERPETPGRELPMLALPVGGHGGFVTVLIVIALLIALAIGEGFALYGARSENAEFRERLRSLEIRIDSLESQIRESENRERGPRIPKAPKKKKSGPDRGETPPADGSSAAPGSVG